MLMAATRAAASVLAAASAGAGVVMRRSGFGILECFRLQDQRHGGVGLHAVMTMPANSPAIAATNTTLRKRVMMFGFRQWQGNAIEWR